MRPTTLTTTPSRHRFTVCMLGLRLTKQNCRYCINWSLYSAEVLLRVNDEWLNWVYISSTDGMNEHLSSCDDDDPVCNSVTKCVTASDVVENCDFVNCASISQSYWSVDSSLCEYFWFNFLNRSLYCMAWYVTATVTFAPCEILAKCDRLCKIEKHL